MGMRHAAVVAGLALGLMSGAAKASAVVYDVDLTVGSTTVTGTVTTNGHSGVLTAGDVTGYNLLIGSSLDTDTDNFQLQGMDLIASGNSLDFNRQNDNALVAFANDQGGTATATLNFYGIQTSGVEIEAFSATAGDNSDPGHNGLTTIGTSTTSVGTVPLPSSAPMFGAALIALGAIGYGLKRKSKAAAAA